MQYFCQIHDTNGILSDHLAVTAKFHLARYIPRKCNKTPQMKTDNSNDEDNETKRQAIDWTRLRSETTSKRFNKALADILAEAENSQKCPFDHFMKAVKLAAAQTAPPDGRPKRPDWYLKSKEMLQTFISNRNRMLKKYQKLLPVLFFH